MEGAAWVVDALGRVRDEEELILVCRSDGNRLSYFGGEGS